MLSRLNLRPDIIGMPDWDPIEPGQLTTTIDQWYDVRVNPRVWKTLPWFTSDKFPCRFENNFRRPVSTRAKVAAYWAAFPKWFKYRVLRRKMK